MKIEEVISEEQKAEFVEFPVRLYIGAKNYIRPLDKDIEAVFDPGQNKYFEEGDCIRWLLKNKLGETIGKVAAFYSTKLASKGADYPTGGLGFFDCIDNQEAADLLFSSAESWLKEKGMEAMDGPVNFGDRDKWWGCLVDGFDKDPNYRMPYNFPYYRKLFETYGFKTYFEQYTFAKNLEQGLHPSLATRAERIFKQPGYDFRHINKKNWKHHAMEFRQVYNRAWAGHDGVVEMSEQQALNQMKQVLPIMDEKVIWFGYYQSKPVCFYINLPEVNQIFKYVDGKLDFVGKLKFLWYQLIKKNRKLLGLVFGVDPDHQGKGLESALIMATDTEVHKKNRRYDLLEFNWIGDFNPRMIKLLKLVGCYPGKTHITFRYMFDPNAEFKKPEILK